MSVLSVGQAVPPLQEAHPCTWALLRSTSVYRADGGVGLLDALREIAAFHYERDPLYRKYCMHLGFEPTRHLDGIDGLDRLPHLSSEVLRHWPPPATATRDLVPREAAASHRALLADAETEARHWAMLAAVMEEEGLVSARPVHHVLFARPPGREARPGGERFLARLAEFAPPGAITFGLKENRDHSLQLDDAGVAEALRRASITGEPVRLIGLPALVARFARAFEAWPIRLGTGSLVLTSGGWDGARIAPAGFRALVEKALGVPATRILDLYRLDEHAATYVACPEHRFHAPVFSRVRAVDPLTLRSQREGEPGVLAMLNPGSTVMPLHALVTADVGRMADCRCGRQTPAFEVLGRGGKGLQRSFATRLLELIDR